MTTAERKKLREKARRIKASRVKAKEKAKKVTAKRKKLREKARKVRVERKKLREIDDNASEDLAKELWEKEVLGIGKTKKKTPTGDRGFGKYKGVWLISGTQEEMSEIDWMKHENAIKAAIRKGQAVEEMISTEESSVCRNNWLKIRAG